MHPAVPIARIRTAPTSHGCAYASPCALSPKSHRAAPAPLPPRRGALRGPCAARARVSGHEATGHEASTKPVRSLTRGRVRTRPLVLGSPPGVDPPQLQLQPASATAAPPVLASPSPVRCSSLSKRCHPPAAWCDAAVGRAKAGARGRVGAGRGAGRADRAGRGGARGGAAGGGLVHGAPSVAPMRSRNRCGGVAVHSLDVREMKMRVAERGLLGQALQLYCAAHPALESKCFVASERLTDAGTVKAAARRGP
jgi:hypothetical protein